MCYSLSDQTFSPSCLLLGVFSLCSSIACPTVTPWRPRCSVAQGGEDSQGLTSLALCHNTTVIVLQLKVHLNHLFFLKISPLLLPHITTVRISCVIPGGTERKDAIFSPGLLLNDGQLRRRLTNPVVAQRQLRSPCWLMLHHKNELCSLSHRDTCECLLSFHMALAQLTRICVSWLSRFA